MHVQSCICLHACIVSGVSFATIKLAEVTDGSKSNIHTDDRSHVSLFRLDVDGFREFNLHTCIQWNTRDASLPDTPAVALFTVLSFPLGHFDM